MLARTYSIVASISLAIGLILTVGARGASAQPVGAGLPAGVPILCNDSYYRVFLAFKTPVFVTPAGQVSVPLDPVSKEPKPVESFQSPLPQVDWAKPDFDDSLWDRQHAPVEVAPAGATGHSPAARHSATCSSLICVRGKFVVADPAKAGNLRLSLEYVGGLVVYVNGQEVNRAHLPAGPLVADTLAEKYPDDLYCEPGGAFLQDIKKNPAGFERRYRRLADLPIPAKLLRKGTNVLAIDVHRSPINEAAIDAKRVAVGGMYVVPGIWAYAGLSKVELTAGPGSAASANIARPRGVKLWNCPPSETVQAFDYGDPGEPLRPIIVPAARNGVFSGRLVVSSDQAIKGLNVSVSQLAATGGAKIPASAVQVRVATAAVPAESWAPAYRYDGLLATIPGQIDAVKAAVPKQEHLGQPLDRKNLACGAVAPIWITIRVPKDARAGKYEGKVQVVADGLAATSVPLVVNVSSWTLADPKDQRIHNLGFLSPESVARCYGVPLWSDKHFQLMGKSLELMAQINSRQVVADLAIGFQGLGSNEESMVRWIRKPDGSFSHDFTILDKFLDLAAKTVGKPLPLRFNCWGEVKEGKWTNVQNVSLLDPSTGKTMPLAQPAPGTAELVEFWKPVLGEIRKRVEARGWYDVTTIGHNSYCYEPSPLTVGTFKQIWPDGALSYSAHNGKLGGEFKTADKDVTMPVRYSECVWTEGKLVARGYKAVTVPRPVVWNSVARNRHRDNSPLTVLRDLPEEMIMRGHDGVGQFGADVFPIRKDGRHFHLAVGRGGFGPDCSTLAILSANPAGPNPTERYEAFREGVQLCEAILFLQRALNENQVSGDLARRVNQLLDERAEAYLRHWSAGRFERDERLLALAGEADAQLQAKTTAGK